MTTQPIKLTAAEGLPLLRQAWIEGRTGIQIGAVDCHYDYGNNCGCAIGVMFPPDLREHVYQAASLSRLVKDFGAIKCQDPDYTLLCRLQEAHDKAIHNREGDVVGNRAAFVRAMNAAFALHGLEPVEA